MELHQLMEGGEVVTPNRPIVAEQQGGKDGQRIAAIRKVRDGYASQARFADVDAASYFREFVSRIDAALTAS